MHFNFRQNTLPESCAGSKIMNGHIAVYNPECLGNCERPRLADPNTKKLTILFYVAIFISSQYFQGILFSEFKTNPATVQN